jgi:hypothetical protein
MAIRFTDIAGYTERDESAAIRVREGYEFSSS